MDPNACLKRIGAPRRIDADCRAAIDELASWLESGGFAPDWLACQRGTKRFQSQRPACFSRYCRRLTTT